MLSMAVLSTIFGSLLTSALLCAVAVALSPRIGFVDRPSGRKSHDKPIPFGGGPAIFLGIVAGILLWGWCGGTSVFANPDHLKIVAAILGFAVIFAVGSADDIRPLGPYVKLAAQLAVATGLYASGYRITAFVYLPVVNYLMTLLWVVLLVNAFNLLDSHDGLAAGVALVCASMLLIVEGAGATPLSSALLPALIGAAAGFLVFNLPPAKLYMGDAGALLLGYCLALASIDATFYSPDSGRDPLFAMFTPLLIFAVPIYDTASVMLIRLKSGMPLLVGDRNHIPHRLMQLGLSKREALLMICLLSVAAGSGSLYIARLSRPEAALVVLQTTAFIVLLFILERLGGRSR